MNQVQAFVQAHYSTVVLLLGLAASIYTTWCKHRQAVQASAKVEEHEASLDVKDRVIQSLVIGTRQAVADVAAGKDLRTSLVDSITVAAHDLDVVPHVEEHVLGILNQPPAPPVTPAPPAKGA